MFNCCGFCSFNGDLVVGLLNPMASSSVAIDLAHSVHINAQMNIYLPELRVLQELVCGFRSV